MALLGKADRVAAWKLVNLGDFQFLKLDSYIATRVRLEGHACNHSCHISLFWKEDVASCRWDPSLHDVGPGHWHVFLHSPKQIHSSHSSAQIGLVGLLG